MKNLVLVLLIGSTFAAKAQFNIKVGKTTFEQQSNGRFKTDKTFSMYSATSQIVKAIKAKKTTEIEAWDWGCTVKYIAETKTYEVLNTADTVTFSGKLPEVRTHILTELREWLTK